jgi:ribosome-associated protein
LATTKKSATKTGASRPKLGVSHKKAAPKAKTSAAPAAKKASPGAAPAKRAPAKKGVDKSRARGTAPRKGEAKRAAVHEAHRGAPVSRRKAEARAASPEINEAAKQVAMAIANAALDKKAVNVQIFDVAGRVDYADYLVLMSGRVERHAVSIADAIEEALIKMTPKRKPVASEGRTPGNWIILDYGDVIAHVFLEEARSFYDFDALWTDARRVPVPVAVAEQKPS